ncbi:O-antigen ligase family protein [Parvularcula marina]|uniref:O-antigen ligase domain-containing protein n=1 Tax=Parvularcula marina TaxID=2292771 RepID=A0A371R7T2_9PROT|nr:O-antigen ligase family protein [Parvularcula marina]RFB01521.1 O-antigen ligase domain-containing protein [Parvularcula marina]
MAKTLLLAGPVLFLLVLATALFGADRPAFALFLSGAFLSVGAVAAWVTPRIRLTPAIWLGLWGGAIVVLGQSLGPHPAISLPDLAVLLAAGAVYLTMAGAVSTGRQAEHVFRAMSIAVLLVGIAAFFNFIASPDTVYGQSKAFHEGRLTAAFLSANTAATLFGMFSLFGLAGVLRVLGGGGLAGIFDRLGKGATLPLLVLIFSLTCLMLTGSRGGIAATIVAGAGLIFWDRQEAKSKLPFWVPVLAILIVGAGLTAASGSVLGDRLTEGAIDGNGRMLIWQVSLAAFQGAPLFGHGFGRFEEAIAPHITLETAPILIQQGAAHNLLLQWLVQGGIVGVAGGLAILTAAILPLRAGLARRRRQRGMMKLAGAMMLLVLLHGMLDYGLEIPAVVWWLSAFLGLGAGVAAAEKTAKKKSPGQ